MLHRTLAVSIAIFLARAVLSSFAPCEDNKDIRRSCSWTTRQAPDPAAGPIILKGEWPSLSGAFPVLLMANQGSGGQDPVSGFSLVLQRLALANVDLAAPDAAGVPQLWPLGMFAAPGINLSMSDVRLVVEDDVFQQQLKFFNSSTAQFHTDGRSFLHIASWTSNMTTLRSVTLVSGPCRPVSATAYTSTAASLAAAAAASKGGCAVRAVDNTTLIPALLQDAADCTPQPLLVVVTANVTLGPGLPPGAIYICRPVVMVGLFTQPTSVDFGMVVNQLNVTAEHAAIYWQSLVLENVAAGDAISALMSAPSSCALSLSLWALYCNRSATCLRLFNTTTVLSSQHELDFITLQYVLGARSGKEFWLNSGIKRYSMFSSPLPSMQATSGFYHSELKVTVLQFVPGPEAAGDTAITVKHMSSLASELVDAVITTQPVVAVKLPPPPGPAVDLKATRPTPLMRAVDGCTSMQTALQHPTKSNRVHILLLLNNITINAEGSGSSCGQQHSISYPTIIYGQDTRWVDLAQDLLNQQQPQLDSAPVVKLDAKETDNSQTVQPGRNNFLALSFSYMPAVMQLPPAADEKYLQLQNITLLQLPQGPDAHKATNMESPMLPDVLTMLLWSINRTHQGSPVVLSDVQMMLPQQEYDFLAHSARTASWFVVQLAGTNGLTFREAVVTDGSLHVSSLQGAGISGTNVWLLPDPTAARDMPGGYVWPQALAAQPTHTQFSSQAVVQAAVGASVGGAGLLLLLLGFCCFYKFGCRPHWLLQHQKQCPSDSMIIDVEEGGSNSGSAGSKGKKQERQQAQGDAYKHVGQKRDQSCTLCNEQLPAAAPAAAAGQHGPVWDSKHAACCLQSSSSSMQVQQPGDSQSEATISPQSELKKGLKSWKAAINSTTLQLMERRMQSLHTTPPYSNNSSSHAGSAHTSSNVTHGPTASGINSSLQLHGLLGQGSFGCVYLGMWHGKRVAVKVMQLPATALLEPQQAGQNSPPHMAIMETVVSSTMSHPNVVQVYTYMINPLTVEGAAEAAGAAAGRGQQLQLSSSGHGGISGWQLKLVMEYCDQDTLREALDHRALLRGSGGPFLTPALVLSLAHDVAAALLHLHSEGVVHGDLKAANVMLTKGGEDPGGVWAATPGYRVTAKVADFGLALPLDPKDTHATMAARGTPTHMSPELFMAGHVSKASDVYAYGILLYEIMTGQRAYAGVPIPLLPHEVARQGLRPTWPHNLPSGCRDMKKLAEACWAQQPQDRPSFQHIFTFLEACLADTLAAPSPSEQQQQEQQQQQHPSSQQWPFPRVSPKQQALSLSRQVDKQLRNLQHSAAQQPLHKSTRVSERQVPVKGMDWSEVI